MLPFMQQMTGVNFLVTQTGKIIGKFDPTLEPYAALIVNSVQFVAIALSILVLSKVGRKPLLQFGNIGIGLINVILGILFFYIEIWKIAFPLTFFFICLFMVVYGFTLGPVIWLYVPEIIPTNIVPLAITMNWIGCSFCVIVCPIISESMNGNPWLIFIFLGAIQLLMFIPNILFVVETKGLPAYEINAKFKWWSFVKLYMLWMIMIFANYSYYLEYQQYPIMLFRSPCLRAILICKEGHSKWIRIVRIGSYSIHSEFSKKDYTLTFCSCWCHS